MSALELAWTRPGTMSAGLRQHLSFYWRFETRGAGARRCVRCTARRMPRFVAAEPTHRVAQSISQESGRVALPESPSSQRALLWRRTRVQLRIAVAPEHQEPGQFESGD